MLLRLFQYKNHCFAVFAVTATTVVTMGAVSGRYVDGRNLGPRAKRGTREIVDKKRGLFKALF